MSTPRARTRPLASKTGPAPRPSASPGTTLSSAGNRLVDEALRSHEHPLVVFRDGPAGRRARLAGGPDVWQVIRAVDSARRAQPTLTSAEVVESEVAFPRNRRFVGRVVEALKYAAKNRLVHAFDGVLRLAPPPSKT